MAKISKSKSKSLVTVDLPAPKTKRPTAKQMAQMVRVDHAGEFGAARIYDGQLAVMGDRHPYAAEIREMKAQEQAHLDTFDRLITERRVRPTLLHPAWNAAGFALGAVTAFMGPKAAMACTAAVEEVITEHYDEQVEALTGHDAELAQIVAEFRDDEAEHQQTALDHGAEDTPGYGLLKSVIQRGCRLAIWTSERI